MPGPPKTKSSILQKIPIAEIKDNTVLMKDTSLRGVLMTNSLNFSLKSTEEQDAITFRYQDFLNSLDFPLQILIVTRKFDVSDYMVMLEKKRNEQDNELLKIQVSEYIDFIKGLTQLVNIMSTFFYLVVPFSTSEEAKKKAKGGGIGAAVTGIFKNVGKKDTQQKTQSYDELRSGLWQRMEYVSSGLSAIGLKTVTLNNEELLELFYRMYNPDAKEKPKMESELPGAADKLT
jgi:type IV secretory pathway VirB4 component